MIKSTMTIDASNFAAMAKDLAGRVNARTFQEVIDAEAGAVLSASATRTKKANAAKIKKRHPEINDVLPTKNDKGWYTPPGGDPVMRKWRIPDARWNAYLAKKKTRITQAERINRIGLAAQGFIQIGEQLNIPVPATSKNAQAFSARVRGRKRVHKVAGWRTFEGKQKYNVVLNYRNPLGKFTGARMALINSINGRVGFFHRNLQHGVFNQAAQVSAKYPGLKITP